MTLVDLAQNKEDLLPTNNNVKPISHDTLQENYLDQISIW